MNNELRIKDLFRKSISILKNSQIPRPQRFALHGGQASPELDARVIFEFVLDIDTAQFYKDSDSPISPTDIKKIEKLIARRAKNEPIAYLTRHKEFFGLDFYVDKNVLIPRPESEELVVKSIKFLKSIKKKEINIVDIGTGSGNIIISISKSYPDANYFASDISKNALIVAQKNARKILFETKGRELENVNSSHRRGGSNNINFIQSDLFSNIDRNIKFDLIIANLPYVPKKVESRKFKVKSDIDFEPKNAIFANDNGAEIIKRFLIEAKDRLNSGGLILIELDPRNATEIKSCAEKNFPNATLSLVRDLAGFNRYLAIKNI